MSEQKKNEEPQIGMVPFEEKNYFDGQFVKEGIFVDGELFDWEVDQQEVEEAMRTMGPEYHRAIMNDIFSHFMNSLSEFMGRKVTPEEVNEARKTGWIKK